MQNNAKYYLINVPQYSDLNPNTLQTIVVALRNVYEAIDVLNGIECASESVF